MQNEGACGLAGGPTFLGCGREVVMHGNAIAGRLPGDEVTINNFYFFAFGKGFPEQQGLPGVFDGETDRDRLLSLTK